MFCASSLSCTSSHLFQLSLDLLGLLAFLYFHLNQFITTLSVSVTVLHQCRCHGWPQRRQRSSGSSTTSAWLVSCVGVYYCFPALLGNISIFQHRPVQRGTWQKESEEAQLNSAKVSDIHDWCVAIFVSGMPVLHHEACLLLMCVKGFPCAIVS